MPVPVRPLAPHLTYSHSLFVFLSEIALRAPLRRLKMCHVLISALHACSASVSRVKITTVTQEGEETSVRNERGSPSGKLITARQPVTDGVQSGAGTRRNRPSWQTKWREVRSCDLCRRDGKDAACGPNTCFHSCFKEETVSSNWQITAVNGWKHSWCGRGHWFGTTGCHNFQP